jgi:hypothetical protein
MAAGGLMVGLEKIRPEAPMHVEDELRTTYRDEASPSTIIGPAAERRWTIV